MIAVRISAHMSKSIAEDGESVPSPTRTPASSSSRSGAVPHPSRAFERGQWATGTSSSARRATSASFASTAWMTTVSGPSTSRKASRCSVSRVDSIRWVATGRPRRRASAISMA